MYYPLLSETEIIKMALSEKYHETVRKTMDEDVRRSEEQTLEQMLLEGRTLRTRDGNRLKGMEGISGTPERSS